MLEVSEFRALLWCCCYLGVTAEVRCLSGAAGSGSALCRQPAGAICKGQRVVSKVLGLWEQAADLGLLTPSCYLHHGRSCNVAAEPFGQVPACGGCRTGSALRRCLLAHVRLSERGPLGALELQASRFCASQADSRNGLFFFFFPLPRLLSWSAFCREWED